VELELYETNEVWTQFQYLHYFMYYMYWLSNFYIFLYCVSCYTKYEFCLISKSANAIKKIQMNSVKANWYQIWIRIRNSWMKSDANMFFMVSLLRRLNHRIYKSAPEPMMCPNFCQVCHSSLTQWHTSSFLRIKVIEN